MTDDQRPVEQILKSDLQKLWCLALSTSLHIADQGSALGQNRLCLRIEGGPSRGQAESPVLPHKQLDAQLAL